MGEQALGGRLTASLRDTVKIENGSEIVGVIETVIVERNEIPVAVLGLPRHQAADLGVQNEKHHALHLDMWCRHLRPH